MQAVTEIGYVWRARRRQEKYVYRFVVCEFLNRERYIFDCSDELVFVKHLHGDRQFEALVNHLLNGFGSAFRVELGGNGKVSALEVRSDFTKPSIVECLL
jgi:hypothetical protein